MSWLDALQPFGIISGVFGKVLMQSLKKKKSPGHTRCEGLLALVQYFWWLPVLVPGWLRGGSALWVPDWEAQHFPRGRLPFKKPLPNVRTQGMAESKIKL